MKIVRTALALLLALSAGAAPARQQQDGKTGVLCTLAILATIDEVGRQCFQGQDRAFQADARDNLNRLSRHVLSRTTMTPAEMTMMLDRVSGRKQPDRKICEEGAEMYTHFRDRGGQLRGWVDEAIARPGTPGWEPCF